MLVTISCKNQTKSVGTFPTCGTESRNNSDFWDVMSEHFLPLRHAGLTCYHHVPVFALLRGGGWDELARSDLRVVGPGKTSITSCRG
jgi:hypothetical protein